MRQLEFIFSILIAICAVSMFITALIKASPVRYFSVSATGMLLAGCLLLVWFLYKEIKK